MLSAMSDLTRMLVLSLGFMLLVVGVLISKSGLI